MIFAVQKFLNIWTTRILTGIVANTRFNTKKIHNAEKKEESLAYGIGTLDFFDIV